MDVYLKFRLTRWIVFCSIIISTIATLVSVLHLQKGMFPGSWVLILWAIAAPLIIIGWVKYRCPFCKAFPENDDVPLFNPSHCCECGAGLRQ